MALHPGELPCGQTRHTHPARLPCSRQQNRWPDRTPKAEILPSKAQYAGGSNDLGSFPKLLSSLVFLRKCNTLKVCLFFFKLGKEAFKGIRYTKCIFLEGPESLNNLWDRFCTKVRINTLWSRTYQLHSDP